MLKLQNVIKPLLIIVVAAQLAFPVYMIVTNEIVFAKGTLYNFRVAPRDPYDPFRGRYVTVRVLDDEVSVNTAFAIGDMAYASIDTFNDYSTISALSLEKPEWGDYLEVRIRNVTKTDSGYIATIDYPFDRIFMNEKIAPLVDTAFSSYKEVVYISVSVKDGKATPQKLFFDGIEAEKFVKEKR